MMRFREHRASPMAQAFETSQGCKRTLMIPGGGFIEGLRAVSDAFDADKGGVGAFKAGLVLAYVFWDDPEVGFEVSEFDPDDVFGFTPGEMSDLADRLMLEVSSLKTARCGYEASDVATLGWMAAQRFMPTADKAIRAAIKEREASPSGEE